MLCYCFTEDGREWEGECREDLEAEGGSAGAADQSVPGPDSGPHPATGPVGARQGEVRDCTLQCVITTVRNLMKHSVDVHI